MSAPLTDNEMTRLATLLQGRPQPGKRKPAGDARTRVLIAWQLLEFDLGYEPTVREVCVKVGRSTGTVQYHLGKLRRAGKLGPAPSGRHVRPHVNGRWAKA